ncbi:cell division protein PerM [Thalassiella azotivora]
MSLLTRAGALRAADPDRPGTLPVQSPFVLGALGALQAGTASLLCVLAPVVVAWVVSTSTGAVWTETVRAGAGAWLLAHHGPMLLESGGRLSLVPLGLTLLPLAWAWSAGRRLGVAVHAVAPSGMRSHVVRALGTFTGCYGALVAGVGLVTTTPGARPAVVEAVAGAVLLAGGAAGAAIARTVVQVRGWPGTTAGAVAGRLRLPVWSRHVLRAAAVTVAAWLAAGAALTAVAVVAGRDRVGGVREAVAPDLLPAAGLTLLDLAYVPTAVVWSASWLAGPGFALGTGTSVTPAAVVLGPLPAMPLLGALPEPGVHPAWWWAVVAVPVLAGVLGGAHLRRATAGTAGWRRLALAPAVGVAAGTAALVLAWLASGAAGGDRLTHLGPAPGWVALAVAGETTAGVLLALLVGSGLRLPSRSTPAAPAGPQEPAPS